MSRNVVRFLVQLFRIFKNTMASTLMMSQKKKFAPFCVILSEMSRNFQQIETFHHLCKSNAFTTKLKT